MMTRGVRISLGFLVLAAWAGPAQAQEVGAISSGNWETASIWTTGSVPGSSNNVFIGSNNTPVGAASTATVTLTASEEANYLYLGYGSGDSGTLVLGSNKLTVSGNIELGNGGTGSITESGGSFTAGGLSLLSSTSSITLGSNDAVSYLQVNDGSSATTSATGNVTGSVDVFAGSTFKMGAALSLPGYLNVENGSTLNVGNNAIAVNQVYLGWNGSSAVNINQLGNLTATSLFVGNRMAFNLGSSDTVTNFFLNSGATSTLNNSVSYLQLQNGSAATTTANGSVMGSIYVYSQSTLILGAALNISGTLNVQGSAVIAQGHGITSNQLFVGWDGSSSASLTNVGPVTTTDLYVGNGSALTLHGGDVVNSLINLQGGSTLTVQEVGGTGLTLNGTSLSSLTIDPSSMDLIFTLNSTPNWDFRWQDPSSGGNWISTIDGLIAGGQIQITAPNGYTVDDRGGYTYIDGTPQGIVPEPSSVIMLSLGALGALGAMAARRRRVA